MAKKKRDPERSALLKGLIAELQPKSMMDLQEQLRDLFAESMEEMLKGELDGHLGYEKDDQSAKATENRRNGSSGKTVCSNIGEIELSIPRDRLGSFEPELVPAGTKDVSGLEDKVLGMHAKGLSDRDISDTIAEIYGFTLSHETISRIVDRVTPRLNEWHFLLFSVQFLLTLVLVEYACCARLEVATPLARHRRVQPFPRSDLLKLLLAAQRLDRQIRLVRPALCCMSAHFSFHFSLLIL